MSVTLPWDCPQGAPRAALVGEHFAAGSRHDGGGPSYGPQRAISESSDAALRLSSRLDAVKASAPAVSVPTEQLSVALLQRAHNAETQSTNLASEAAAVQRSASTMQVCLISVLQLLCAHFPCFDRPRDVKNALRPRSELQ